MKIEFDPAKDASNQVKHGLTFDGVLDFQWETAWIEIDERHDYGETRWIATGMINYRLHVLCFTMRDENMLRVISLRKANDREVKCYGDKTTTFDQ